ncbi:MAG: DinB family protein [Planctomycetota bacterium]|jgi:uncharacterized damage-inducible protein DinB
MSNVTAEHTLTPVQAEAVRDAGLFSLSTIRWFTSQLIENLTPEQWVYQASSGVNHILWNVGHIAVSDMSFMAAIGGSTPAVPERYNEMFGMNSDPKPSLDAYPGPTEVVEVFHKVRGEFVNHLNGLSGEQLAATVESESLRQVVPTVAQIATFSVLHESTHAGQILIARKALGLPRVLG